MWNKNNHGTGDLKGSYAPKHEFILYGHKGRCLNKSKRMADVIDCKKVRSKEMTHPTEKPTEPETQKPVVNTKEEGKNSAPETVKENKVVEPEKLVDTALQKMETTILKTVELVSPKPQTLTKEVFDTIQSEGKNLTVGVTNEDNQLQYSWTFSNKAMNNTDMNILRFIMRN